MTKGGQRSTSIGLPLVQSFGALQTIFDFLEALEVTKWQGVNAWLYSTAVSRAQVKVPKQRCIYFLRDRKSVIVEVKIPSYKCRELKQKFTNNKKWFFTLVAPHIYFYENQSLLFGLLENDGASNFTKYYKAETREKRAYPALCQSDARFIYLTGGVLTNKVERYIIESDTWEELPSLKEIRNMHASVYLDDYLYVLCGQRKQHECLNSIETLDCRALDSGEEATPEWQVINVDSKILAPRF